MYPVNKRAIKQHTEGTEQFIPTNIDKYAGRLPILSRSSWEMAFMRWCDHSSSIIRWSSEEIVIRYQDPLEPIRNNKPRFRSYYPDFMIVTEKGDTYLIEIKPAKETKPPVRRSTKSTKTMLTEEMTWRTNQAKWRAAENYCKQKGWQFKIFTEHELFGK